MTIKRRAAAFLAVLTLLMNLVIPALAATDSRVVRIGFYTMPGFQTVEQDGTLSGYMYDYLQEIAKYTHWTYEYEQCSFLECLQKIKSGEIDFMSGMQQSMDRDHEYLFPENSCGSMNVGLYVHAADTEYAYGDTANFSNLRVGIIAGMELKKDFEKYCSQYSVAVKSITEYTSDELLMAAFEKGDVDALCVPSTYGTVELRCIASFAYKSFYMMTAQGNEELVQQLDDALSYIKIQNPNFEQSLWNRYVSVARETKPVFTKEELAFLAECGTINAVYNKNWIPMESYNEETDSFDGIGADIFALISEMSGLKFNFIPEESYATALEIVKHDDVSVICSTVNDYAWAEQNQLKLSNEYLSVPVVIVSSGAVQPQNMTIAMPKGLYLTQKIMNDMPESTFLEFANYTECLQAIKNGQANATIMNSYMATEYLRDASYGRLTASSLYGYTYHFCVGFSNDTNDLLVSIIDKTLACIAEAQITDIVVAETVKHSEISALDLIYQHPMESVAAIALFLGLLIVLLFIILRNKSKYASRLYNLINLDPITGMNSFFKFRTDATEILNTPNHPDYAVLYFNIQRFKDVNDIYGYSEGDHVLKSIAQTLKKHIGRSECFARMHSDRFILLMRYFETEDLERRYEQMAEEVGAVLKEKLPASDMLCRASVYILPPDLVEIGVAINYAGYAYEYGAGKPTGLLYYDEALKEQIHKERSLEADMEQSLSDGEFQVFYQPKVNSVSGEVSGAEALVRWQHKERGLIPPADFIPVFEKNGFVLKIDLFVFEAVCSFLANRAKAGLSLFPISCNFSRLHFIQGNMTPKLVAITDQYGIDRSLIEVELTETMAMEELDIVKGQLEELHAQGFRISIDDFGSGYSSLGILSEICFDVVKLDRCLIVGLEKSEYNKLILAGKAGIIHSLNKKVICEGVETQGQIDLLKSMDCTEIQGYFYSKPLREKDFTQYIANAQAEKKVK